MYNKVYAHEFESTLKGGDLVQNELRMEFCKKQQILHNHRGNVQPYDHNNTLLWPSLQQMLDMLS